MAAATLAAALRQRARAPAQARAQPAAEQHGGRGRVGAVADRDAGDLRQPAAQLGRIEGGGHALAPRRRAQPREVDDVRALEQPVRARERRPHLGLVLGVHEHHLHQPAQCVDGGRVPVRRPHQRREVGYQQRVDDRVERLQMALAELELDPLPAERERALGPLGGDAAPGVDRRAARVHRAQDEPRRVVAADALEPVLDLAPELAVDDHDEVEHARRDEGVLVVVALDQEPAQRRLDLARRRVALAPDLLAHGTTITARATCAGRSARRPRPVRATRPRTWRAAACRPATPRGWGR